MLGLVLTLLAAFDGAVVEGRVVAAATGEPLSKARVALRGSRGSYSATSGEDGRFALSGIEPGNYMLAAERNGYIRQSYGTRIPGRPGTRITLAQGEALRDVSLRLTAMAVISGRVTDEDGEPFPRVQVRALRMRWSDGASRLVPIETARSDDRGEYRLFGLPPGRYWVSAEPETERGTGEPRTYTRVFYPGVYEPREASVQEVSGGNELRGMDFRIGRAATVSIRGRVLMQQPGRPATGVVVFANRAESLLDQPLNAIVQDPNGAFEIRGVLPGPYILTARAHSGGSTAVGRVRVDAGESGADGVAIALGSEFRVAGRVRAQADVVLSTITVVFAPKSGGAARVARADSSGAFALRGLGPDLYGIDATGLPEGTWLHGFRLGTTDLRGAEVDLTQDPGAPLELVLSDGAASVEGLVLDEAEKPVVGASVALLPPSERFGERRLLRFASTNQHGRYALAGVAPGEYTLIAWDGLDPDLLQDHDFLRSQLDRGQRISIAARDKQAVQLKAVVQ